MLLGEETTPLQHSSEALQPGDLKLQLEKLQGCIERALQKVFTKQEEIERHVKTISDNLQGKRKTPAEEVRDGRSLKKAKPSCPKCQGDHPDLRCRLIPTEERIGMAVRRGTCGKLVRDYNGYRALHYNLCRNGIVECLQKA
ncbi:hypothetical protein CAEBREN_09867 [Caenorhabditis brenneri]|uniref:Uncharacterized protein n=1 Tax=Caenorhabditis brenneri TaxID=135651 RepID=G0NS24_CAEBE|nr:hypothetical protein CAEBREN_09867 [Caenorhabditis brenneri]